jgi:small subunit ribosomal protein S1
MSNEVIKEAEEIRNDETTALEVEEKVASAKTAADEGLSEQQNSGDEDFGKILEKFEQDQIVVHTGEIVTGKVIGVSEHGVVVDFGYKSEGIAPIEEFTRPDGSIVVKEGDEIEVLIKTLPANETPPVLSFRDALRRKAWEEIEKAYKEGKPVKGFVAGKTKGGLQIDLHGIEAFMPGSLVDSRPTVNLDDFFGQEIEAKVIKFSRRKNNIVLSRKELTDEIINQQKAAIFNSLEVGYVVEGTIKNLTEYGAFVDIGGIDGLLHVTDMSWGRMQNPSELFKVGDHVQVKILKLDKEKEKVSLGYKHLIPDPWSTVAELYPVGEKFKGKVSSVTDYGAFVELEPGVEGLVHVSEMSWSKRTKNPKTFLKVGDEIEVQVLGVDTEEKRISLGIRQLQPNPWETAAAMYRVGTTVTGKVRNLTDFGAFIELEGGIDGLVHVSDISRSKKIKHPKEVLKKGQEVQAVVTSIDPEAQKMSLSIKELIPSAWESFVAKHKPGDVVRGKISRFAGFGVFVELDEDLEGLCHISELSDERIEKPEKLFHIGQELEFKILRIEHDSQKIGLSHRAVGKEDEPEIDYKAYSTEAKSGMASLAELANLKFPSLKTESLKKEEPKEKVQTEEEPEKDIQQVEKESNDLPQPEGKAEASPEDTASDTHIETGQAPTESAETIDSLEETESSSAEASEVAESAKAETSTEEAIATEEKSA